MTDSHQSVQQVNEDDEVVYTSRILSMTPSTDLSLHCLGHVIVIDKNKSDWQIAKRRDDAYIPRMLAMTVVTSKLQASAAIMTPPGRPSTRKLDNTCGDKPALIASHALDIVTPDPFASCGHATQMQATALTCMCVIARKRGACF